MNSTTNPVIAAVADASGEMLALEPQSPSSSSSSEAEREDDVLGVAADIQKLIASAPESIYLDLGENLEALTDEATFRDLTEVTWSEDNASSVGIKYVRADLIATPTSLPIDFKQASEQGDSPSDRYLRREITWNEYQAISEEAAENSLPPSPHPKEGALLQGVADGDAVGGKSGGAA